MTDPMSERERRRRRGLAKVRAVLAQEPLPLEPEPDDGLSDRERLLRQAAADYRAARTRKRPDSERPAP